MIDKFEVRYTPVTIRFTSIKDLGIIHELHLRNLEESVKVLEDKNQLESARWYVGNILSSIKTKLDGIYMRESSPELYYKPGKWNANTGLYENSPFDSSEK